jgi:hypothetical protein
MFDMLYMSTFYHGLVIYHGPGDAYEPPAQKILDEQVAKFNTESAVSNQTLFGFEGRRGFIPKPSPLGKNRVTANAPMSKTNMHIFKMLNSGLGFEDKLPEVLGKGV